MKREPNSVVSIICHNEDELAILLSMGIPIAQASQGQVQPLCIADTKDNAAWACVPIRLQETVLDPIVVTGEDWVSKILALLRRKPPQLALMVWGGETSRWRGLGGAALDTVVRQAPCDVAVLRTTATPLEFARYIQGLQHILVGWGGGPNSVLGVQLGLKLNNTARVTAMSVLQEDTVSTARMANEQTFKESFAEWSDEQRLNLDTCYATNVVDGLMQEAAKGYDLVIVGATAEGLVTRFLFGNLTQKIASSARLPLVVVRKLRTDQVASDNSPQRIAGIRQLSMKDQARVYQQVKQSARGDIDFRVMIILASAVASFGLLLNNVAVIIGGMIIAPLMSPIMGLSLGIIHGDRRLIRTTLVSTMLGILLAVITSLVCGLVVPNHLVTAEMYARGNPSLLDLAVALVAGIAAAYANARREVSSALPGVAVAVSLVPPLATVGLALIAGDGVVAFGALLLFTTNLVAIVAAATATFAIIGFSPMRGNTSSSLTFSTGLVGTLVALVSLVLVLAPLTVQSFKETDLRQRIQTALQTEVTAIGPGLSLSSWKLERTSGQTLFLEVEVKSENGINYADVVGLQERVATRLQRPVALVISLIPITQLDPLVPPTFTLTPVPTSTPTPTPTLTMIPSSTPTSVPTSTPNPTPTLTTIPSSTPSPTITLTPGPSASPTGT
ncbi:MAG: TIGR00341 family protein [Anaerolineae bacterium]